MSAAVGLIFLIGVIVAAPGLLRLLVAVILWAIVLAGIVTVAAPIILAVVGISSL